MAYTTLSAYSANIITSLIEGNINPEMGMECFQDWRAEQFPEYDDNWFIEIKDEATASTIISQYHPLLQEWLLLEFREEVSELNLHQLQYLSAQAWQANSPEALSLCERLLHLIDQRPVRLMVA